MEFCDDCGGMLVSENQEGDKVMKCRSCGKIADDTDEDDYKVTEEKEEDPMDRLNVNDGSEESIRPTTQRECPQCSENSNDKKEHEWWMEQTRASDEPETRFYKCTECGNVHKVYD